MRSCVSRRTPVCWCTLILMRAYGFHLHSRTFRSFRVHFMHVLCISDACRTHLDAFVCTFPRIPGAFHVLCGCIPLAFFTHFDAFSCTFQCMFIHFSCISHAFLMHFQCILMHFSMHVHALFVRFTCILHVFSIHFPALFHACS